MKRLSVLFTLFLAVRGDTAVPPPGPDGKYTLVAEGIRAQFIPHAASITNLFVKDKNGIERDIVVGFDNAADYTAESAGHYGAIPGRYVNGIKDAQYTMDGEKYYTEKNNVNHTLHSGTNGWGYRTFNVTAISSDSITFYIRDLGNSSMGMPGVVDGYITYTLSYKTWSVKLSATAPEHNTPLMLTQHTYWNLDAFSSPDTDLILDHKYHMPFSRRLLEPDPMMVPTGKILDIPEGDINDFWSKPKLIGADIDNPLWFGNCGPDCGGYNNCWLADEPRAKADEPVATLSSEWSGIKVDIYTNQAGMQVYSTFWQTGTTPIKKTQGGPEAATNGFLQPSGCIALEPHDWVGGINHPEWGRKQFYGPGETYVSEMTYKFSTL